MINAKIESERPKILVISRCAWTLFNLRLPLIKSIESTGAKVVALGAGGDGYEQRLREAGVDYRPIPVGKRSVNPLADIYLLATLLRIMLRERPAVVHCFTIKPVLYGLIAAWVCRVRVRVATITGLGYSFTSAGRLLSTLVRTLYRGALSRAHLVYFQNGEDRDLFLREGLIDLTRARLVPGTGVDVERFSSREGRFHGGGRRFLMVSRLLREKGVLEYIEAATLVKRSYPHLKFVLLGGEDPRNPTRLSATEIESLRQSDVVQWVGETSDVRPFIAEADIVVLPSYREGLPRSLLEAAAMARPVIATDAVGCRDVVVNEVTGFLVPIKDAVGLADAMRKFVDMGDDRLVSMGSAARAHMVANFDERQVIMQTLRSYDEFLGKRS